MEMNDNINIIDTDFIGERMSFLQLVRKYNIVIPVIQRDYAQGRLDEHATDIRKNFVRNLISYLKDQDKSSHDLDFIYGTVNPAYRGDQEFIPLDGQQRLTTLFLFHLYIAGRSNHYNDFINLMRTNSEFKFSYKTRNSSRMFCEKLMSKFEIVQQDGKNAETDIFQQLIQTECLKKIAGESEPKSSYLSEVIQNQGWFYNSWLEDPTVSGMLTMLEEIDNQFLNEPDGYDASKAYVRLFDEDDLPPVTFQLLPMKGYSRTDDLYIKLNARGIHLSDFENFKARLEELMEYDQMDFKDDFKLKIDVDWNDYLWKFCGTADKTDRLMENLFRNFIAFCYRLKVLKGKNSDKIEDIMKERMDYLLEQNKKKMRFTFSRYCNLEVVHRKDEKVEPARIEAEKEMVKNIISFFNIYCDDRITPERSTNKWLNEDSFIQQRWINSNASYSNRLRLYAYLKYRSINDIELNEEDLDQWLRLIRNLDVATDIDDSYDFYQAVTSIDDMLNKMGTKEVQEWLVSMNGNDYENISFFRSREMKEECIKAQLIKREKELKESTILNTVLNCDDNKYLQGQMGFILEFSGAYEKYEEQSILSMNRDEIISIGKDIKSYAEKFISIISSIQSDLQSSSPGKLLSERLLERALLSLGMYLRGYSANRWNFCNRPNDPYYSWKTLLFVEKENEHCRQVFKTMLDNISVNSIEQDLNAIIANRKDSIPEWIELLIQNKDLINYCSQGFLYLKNNSSTNPNVVLFSQSQMNHYHSELWSYDAYLKTRSKYPIKYRSQKNGDDDTSVYIPFEYKDKKYEFHLAHWDDAWSYWICDVETERIVDDTDLQVIRNNIVINGKEGVDIIIDTWQYFKDNCML